MLDDLRVKCCPRTTSEGSHLQMILRLFRWNGLWQQWRSALARLRDAVLQILNPGLQGELFNRNNLLLDIAFLNVARTSSSCQ